MKNEKFHKVKAFDFNILFFIKKKEITDSSLPENVIFV